MTKEQILEKHSTQLTDGTWICSKGRRLKAMEEYADQEVAKEAKRAEYAEKVGYETSKKNADLMVQLAKERERYDELKAKYDSVVMDNMAHEFNQAEAEKFAPEYERQILEEERERAGKLVEALKHIKFGIDVAASQNANYVIETADIELIKQALTEYENSNGKYLSGLPV